MIDFRKKVSLNRETKTCNPIDLYDTLDRKSITGPLRASQKYILNEWYENRKEDKDLIVKLHTGEGKTLIGLLMLQSIINMKQGPCVYVCPNKYLAKQVSKEAEKFGIPYCLIEENNQIPNDFYSGNKTLITHAHKIFNGKSIFGTGMNFIKTGAIVLDDSHACIDVIRDAFTIKLDRSNMPKVYGEILTLFRNDFLEQGEGSFLDIENGDYNTFMKVPYWAWFDKQSEMLTILSEFKDIAEIKFAWDLIKDNLFECECYISGQKIEIAPSNIRVDDFGTFSKAERKILMSATTQDDIFFVKGLGLKPDSVENPLIYPDMKWSGEKMILIPSMINENIDRDLIGTEFAGVNSKNFGIVVIVPNTKRTHYYKNLGANYPEDNENLITIIENLKKAEFGSTVVLNNRYDGIDLPDESCRILILDSMPYLNDFADKYEEQCYPNSEIMNKKLAQKIEQGLGRAVRGEKDYCAIIITGKELVKFLIGVHTNQYFSSQTRRQIEIGLEVAEMAKDEIREDDNLLKPVISLINQMGNRDEGWKEYYQESMDELIIDDTSNTRHERILKEAEIEQFFSERQFQKAAEVMQAFIDENVEDTSERGWYLEKLARYKYFYSKEESIKLQSSAFKCNKNLLKPVAGVEYQKVSFIDENRADNIKSYLRQFNSYGELKLHITSLLDDLSFGIESKKFETALKELGEFLGFISQRPDQEIRKGPDNLWCGEGNNYLLFECKNEVSEGRAEITKMEAGQMNNHCGWFDSKYGKNVKVSNFMIIPTKDLAYEADFTHDVKIIRKNGLRNLKKNIKGFINELSQFDIKTISSEVLQKNLDIHKLNMDTFSDCYSEKYFHRTS